MLHLSTGDEVKVPDGFFLEHDCVQPEVWEAIRHWLSTNILPPSTEEERLAHVPIPWETGPEMQGRRIAQFGNCKYDYVADVAVRCVPPKHSIPEYIRQTLLSSEHNIQQYTQCIINAYGAENEIPWHVDHRYFGPDVLVYTFGEDRPLLLRKPLMCADDNEQSVERTNTNGEKYIYSQGSPRHRSKYVLTGSARHVWEHSVPSGKGERVSITFRSWVGPTESTI